VDAQPGATASWEICPASRNCGSGTACCEAHTLACDENNGGLPVVESQVSTFAPQSHNSESAEYTEKYASFVKLVLGVWEGLLVSDAILCLTVFGVVLPIVMGFVWAIFLWFFAGIVVYVLIAALVFAMAFLDIFLMVKAGWFTIDTSLVDDVFNSTAALESLNLTGEADADAQGWFAALAVIALVVTAFFVIFLVIYRSTIVRLIAILQECTKVFKAMFLLVLVPLIDVILQILTFTGGLLALYFAANAQSSLLTEEWHVAVLVIFEMFMIFWTSQFIRATVWTSMAAAICRWFVEDNAPDAEKPCCGMGSGTHRIGGGLLLVLSKHLGSMAFGALIIAIVQTIRAVVTIIDYYTQDAQNANFLIKLAVKCLQYCLACIQRTIEFVSYYGFIFVALQGDGFCKSCWNTLKFVINNPAQTAVNKTVQALLRILIGYSTPALSATFTFLYLEYGAGDYPKDYNTYVASFAVFLVAFLVTGGVTMTYDCAIDTIYLCAFKDMDENSPPKYMSDDLRKGFGIDEASKEASAAAQKHETQATRRGKDRDNKDAKYTATSSGVGDDHA